MKTLILFIGLFISSATIAQSYNDTIFFNSGKERVVHVMKETKNAISYQYQNDRGTIKSGRVRKSMLFGYAIYNEDKSLVSREVKEIQSTTELVRKKESNKVGKGVGVVIVCAGVAAGAVVVAVGAAVIWIISGIL